MTESEYTGINAHSKKSICLIGLKRYSLWTKLTIKTIPITYKIKDLKGEPILGSFYKEELSKTKFLTF